MSQPGHPRVTAVVVAYNSDDTIVETLGALHASVREGLLRVVVVDNASKDETVRLVESHHPWATLIESPVNLGYGKGCNRGFEESCSEYTFFLNADAWLTPSGIRALADFMDAHPRAGFAGPAFRTPTGHLHSYDEVTTPAGILMKAAWPRAARRRKELIPDTPAFRVVWFPGAAVFSRSSAFRQIGGFDPTFFLYFEETDLLLRAREQGFEIWAVCGAVGHHVGGASARREGGDLYDNCISEHYFRSRLYYLKKHYGVAAACFTELAEIALLGAGAVPRVLLGRRPGALASRLKGPILRLPDSA